MLALLLTFYGRAVIVKVFGNHNLRLPANQIKLKINQVIFENLD